VIKAGIERNSTMTNTHICVIDLRQIINEGAMRLYIVWNSKIDEGKEKNFRRIFFGDTFCNPIDF
jgi:hypothetical protein